MRREQDASFTAFVASPAGKNRSQIVHVSPASASAQNSIYLFHDAIDAHHIASIRPEGKIDLEGELHTPGAFYERISPLAIKVLALKQSGKLHQFHRYVGQVTEGTSGERTFEDRFKDHISDCNSFGARGEKRFCLGLRNNSGIGRKTQAHAIVTNIHPEQIHDVEAYLISLYGGLEDLGWNSIAGRKKSKKFVKKVFRYHPSPEALSAASTQLEATEPTARSLFR